MSERSGPDAYKPDKTGLMLKYGSIAATGIMAGGSLLSLASCSNRREQWAETSGKAGQINMEAVEEAMKKSKDVSEFEKRVNEIYQGDELVLIEVKNQGNEQLVSGYADLNNNNQIDYDSDDKLFTFRRWFDGDKQRAEMRGYGVNSYYYHPYPSGMNLLTTYLLINALTQPRYRTMPVYHTTVSDARRLRTYRSNYRRTPSYRNQIDTNRRFQSRMSTKHGTTYRKASASSNRQRWATRKGINLNKAVRFSKVVTPRKLAAIFAFTNTEFFIIVNGRTLRGTYSIDGSKVPSRMTVKFAGSSETHRITFKVTKDSLIIKLNGDEDKDFAKEFATKTGYDLAGLRIKLRRCEVVRKKAILGKWKEVIDGETLEFQENGNVIFDEGYGHYEFIDNDSKIIIDFEGNLAPQGAKVCNIISITNDELTLIVPSYSTSMPVTFRRLE